MKNYILSLLTLACLSVCLASCGNKDKSNADANKSEVVDKTSKEYASAYTCPMHCKGSGSEKAGKCPVCKMDYVANKEYKNEHGGHDHEGHNHGDHDGHDHGNHEGHDHNNHEGHGHDSHEGHNH